MIYSCSSMRIVRRSDIHFRDCGKYNIFRHMGGGRRFDRQSRQLKNRKKKESLFGRIFPSSGPGAGKNHGRYDSTKRSDKFLSPLSRMNLYHHAHKGVFPLYGNAREGNAFVGLGVLTAINGGVYYMWNISDDDDHQDFMRRNFTINLTNLKEGRIWTLVTCSFSHQSAGHLAGNLFALWLFGFKTFRVLNAGIATGAPGFFGLYITGSFACATAHCLHNLATGRVGPTLTNQQVRMLTDAHNHGVPMSKEWERYLARQDMPSLGASGSVMATVAASMSLFPRDGIRSRQFMYRIIPIPLAGVVYFVTDFLGLLSPNTNTDHAGHIGGAVAGFAYVGYVWKVFGKRAGPVPLVLYLRGFFK